MSGGAFDYAEQRLNDLADLLEIDRPYESDSDYVRDLHDARFFLADLLRAIYDQIHQIDYHLSGDSEIDDEAAWLREAKIRIRAYLDLPT